MKTKIYKIEVKEILSKIIAIEAKNEQEAVQKIKDMYKKEEIVLDADNFHLVKIEVYKDQSFLSKL